MPTRNVNLTPELDRFVSSKIDTGLYANASEVVRAALRLLDENERKNAGRSAALVPERSDIPESARPRLLSESLRILRERSARITLDAEFGSDLEKIIQSHTEPLNPPAWD